jgi:hypothetical protein
MDWLLNTQLRHDNYMNKSKRAYFTAMVEQFIDIKDPTDLVALATRLGPNPYQGVIDRTGKHSGLNDRHTDRYGNEYDVEEEEVMG